MPLVRAEDVAELAGNRVLIGGVGVRVLARALRNERYLARRNGTELPTVLAALLGVVEQAEATAGRPRPAAVVSTVDWPGFPAGPSSHRPGGPVYASVDVARRAGVSRQAVRKAARQGRLAGRLTDGAWTFTEAAVQAWIAGRNR
jgi:hypothetical protein